MFLRWEDPLPAALSALGGMAAACVVFVVLRDRRRRKLRNQLPTTAERLARAVRAGESIEQALLSINGQSSTMARCNRARPSVAGHQTRRSRVVP